MKPKKDWRSKDPEARAEARKYDQPIPSRQYLLETLESHGAPMARRELGNKLGLERDVIRGPLKMRLRAMVRDGQLIKNRRAEYCLIDKLPVVVGNVQGHRDGFGFLRPDDGSKDIFLGPRQMRSLMHGDLAAVRIKGLDRRGRPEGSLVEVLDRRTTEIVGRYTREGGVGFVVPDNPRITHQVVIPPRKSKGAKSGQIVSAAMIEPPTEHSSPVGEIVEILGVEAAPGMETDIAIRAHGLPHRWPREVEGAIAGLSKRVATAAKKGRVDLRSTPLVTIDGADARDFDDAVYCEPVKDGWKLFVAIADVAHYVEHGSPLDDEAVGRGTSVYFPNRVIPMLPEILSNGLCSLNPKVDRLCMVCEMHIGRGGKLGEARFYEAVMRSAARLTYSEVATMLADGQATNHAHNRLLPQLEDLNQMYRALAVARKRRGAIDFDMAQSRFVFDDQQRVAGVERYVRNDAHRIIEECMIAANVQAARFLAKHRMPTLYRVHADPEEDRVESLREFLTGFDIRLPHQEKLTPQMYQKILREVAGQPEQSLIEMVMLRSMATAVYQARNDGHFGLALKEYAHFTSPIRRYPDLIVHRGIKHILNKGKARDFIYAHPDMDQMGRHCSGLERRADEATREAMDWLKCEFMQDKIGKEYSGKITGVTDFGVFVELADMPVEGLVHVSALGTDYFRFDPVKRVMAGENSGRRFALTDEIRVKIAGVNMEDRKIDFELAGSAGRGDGREGRSRRGKRRR